MSLEVDTLLAELDDDGKLRRKYINKKHNACKENLVCELSLEEYCLLVKQAGLKSSDIGFSGNGYVLARYHDNGNYTFTNCRFITQKENAREKVRSEKEILASYNNIRQYNLSCGRQLHKINHCIDCGKEILYSHKRCKECNDRHIKEISHCPSKEELFAQISSTKSMLEIAKEYQVSDRAVRKWCKKYNLPYTVKQRKTLW